MIDDTPTKISKWYAPGLFTIGLLSGIISLITQEFLSFMLAYAAAAAVFLGWVLLFIRSKVHQDEIGSTESS